MPNVRAKSVWLFGLPDALRRPDRERLVAAAIGSTSTGSAIGIGLVVQRQA